MSRDHILDISELPARLSVRNGLLCIDSSPHQEVKLIPFVDIAVLIVAHPQVSYSQAVLAQLSSCGGVFVCCDEKRLPNGMLLPLRANTVQTERFAAQASLALPIRKRLWQQVVRKKIEAQAKVLEAVRSNDYGLKMLMPRVRSGDPENIEAQAAKRYWSKLLARPGFRRQFEAIDENQFFNYGYAVLRSIVARAICAAGLHPSVGIHHHNRYNAYCLADDLMEPLRAIVDCAVCDLLASEPIVATDELNSAAKSRLLNAILRKQKFGHEHRTVFDVAAKISSSLASVVAGETKSLNLPTLSFSRESSHA